MARCVPANWYPQRVAIESIHILMSGGAPLYHTAESHLVGTGGAQIVVARAERCSYCGMKVIIRRVVVHFKLLAESSLNQASRFQGRSTDAVVGQLDLGPWRPAKTSLLLIVYTVL